MIRIKEMILKSARKGRVKPPFAQINMIMSGIIDGHLVGPETVCLPFATKKALLTWAKAQGKNLNLKAKKLEDIFKRRNEL